MKILEEEPPLADECKLPWLIDAFLYPISASGMINLAVFVLIPEFVSLLVSVLASFLAPFLQFGTSYIITLLTLPFYIVFGCYVVYYVAHCVIDSTKGCRRATDLPMAKYLQRRGSGCSGHSFAWYCSHLLLSSCILLHFHKAN